MSSKSSKTEGRTDLPETIAVARVLRPHGLRGDLAVEILSDVPGRLDAGSSLLLVRAGKPTVSVVVSSLRMTGSAAATAPAAAAGEEEESVGAAAGRRSVALVRFAGVEDRDAADAWRGGWLEIELSRVPPAPEGVYYHHELMGCRCSDGGEDLGTVVEVVEDGGGLLLIVSNGSRQVPVPFVARFLRAVDVKGGRIEVELPPGLLDVCASRS